MGSTELVRRIAPGPKRNSHLEVLLNELPDQQRRFCLEYALSYKGRDAAIAAGYSKKVASVRANKLLKNPKIQRVLRYIQRREIGKFKLEEKRILEELACLVFRDVADFLDADGILRIDDLRKLPKRIRVCIDGIKCKQRLDEEGNIVGQSFEIKLSPKLAAIELAMKHRGMLTEKHEVTGRVHYDWDSLYARTRAEAEEAVPDELNEVIEAVGKVHEE